VNIIFVTKRRMARHSAGGKSQKSERQLHAAKMVGCASYKQPEGKGWEGIPHRESLKQLKHKGREKGG